MNWLQLIVAAIIPMITGFLWYGPMLFQNAWMKSIGMTEEKQKQGNMGLIFGLSFVLAFVLAMFVSFNVNHDVENFATFGHGAFHGMFVGLMVAIPVLVTNSLFEQKSWTNIAINCGYWVITIALMGGLLCAWQ